MQDIITFINQNYEYAHWIIFSLLLLAGLNLPVSEDMMLLISGLLAASHPENMYLLFGGVFMGAYFSDLISYAIGRLLGPKIWNVKLFKKFISKDKIQNITNYYEKYGVITLIVGRFIPFGVRNALFLSAGLGKMNFIKFALSDLLACTISTVSFFYIYMTYGKSVITYVKQGNIILFSILLSLVLGYLLIKYFKKKKAQKLL